MATSFSSLRNAVPAGFRAEPFLARAQALGEALMSRAELALRKSPAGIKGPRLVHFLREADVIFESARRRRNPLKIVTSPAPKLVMLLPGLGTHPIRMRYMAEQLETAGHTAKRWGLGFNFGPTPENFAFLDERLRELHERDGRKLHLVGWSLGGIFARELARRHPDAVAKVVTMGSPFSGDAHANNVWWLYQMIAGHPVDAPPVPVDRACKPPVPTVALWSPRDGIVHARAARGKPGERDREVALRCSHMGFSYSHESIAAVLRELERAD